MKYNLVDVLHYRLIQNHVIPALFKNQSAAVASRKSFLVACQVM